MILPRREGVEYSAEHAVIAGEDRFLILHNDVVDGEKAENFVLAQAPVTDPAAMEILSRIAMTFGSRTSTRSPTISCSATGATC